MFVSMLVMNRKERNSRVLKVKRDARTRVEDSEQLFLWKKGK
jgi:hypothetical protein